MRVLRKAESKAERNPTLKDKLGELGELWGVEPKNLHTHLQQLGPRAAADFIRQQGGLLHQLGEVAALLGSERLPVISQHADEIRERKQTYGVHSKPADYLDSFNQFIREQINQSAALKVVVTRPRDLTREQLREIRLLLDGAGYSEARLQSAVRHETNQDIAASIIGHIRRAALGEALLPFETRVAQGMDQIYRQHPWTPAQRQWLARLARQLVHEVILDRDFVNNRFAEQGGAKQLDRVLGEKLDAVLKELGDALWPQQSA